jgi:hypothetical protein
MTPLGLLAAPSLALAVLAGDGGNMILTANVQVGCEIRAARSDAGTRLDAVISASGGPVVGSYRFRVEPMGGGDPLVAEEADFAIEGTAPSEVKKASIDLPAGQGYQASLSIEWPDGSSSCSAAAS